jgi:POT family proton-dependent oligopeptide transporter
MPRSESRGGHTPIEPPGPGGPAPGGPPSGADDTGFFGHPRGLAVLFFSELWERFSFYGMRALLVLYMVQQLQYDETARAYPVYGAYGALVYAYPVLGGWVANQWLGYRNAIVLGGVLMALGHFSLAFEDERMFYLGMGLLCVGNGFFKPNISSTVGRLYATGDLRRDRGFTIFYQGINWGAFLAPLVCGSLGEGVGWHYGFAAAGVGMVIGLTIFLTQQRLLHGHADPDDAELLRRPLVLGLTRLHLIVAAAFAAAPLSALCLYHFEVAERLIQIVSVGVLVILLALVARQDAAGRLRLLALVVLMFFHMAFWAGFEQAGSSFNLMTDNHVNRVVAGKEIPASVFQFVNPAFIILLVPLFTFIWRRLQAAGRDPSIAVTFALGLAQLGLGFWVLSYGIRLADPATGTVALMWMVLCYLLHTTGELCLSPVGLSAVTKLAPQRWVGFCMGAWFLTIANAHLIAAAIAALTGGSEDGAELTGYEAVQQYGHVFDQVGWFGLGAAVLLLALSPFLKKMVRGVQ